jgi:hypothetical protein
VDYQAAYALIDVWLKELRHRSYRNLVSLIAHPETRQVLGEDQEKYQLEAEVFWDSKKGGAVRVMVAADNGGLSAFKPLTSDFIMGPDGSFVGESLGEY